MLSRLVSMLLLSCVLSSCVTRRAVGPAPIDWSSGRSVGYRLVTKDDFQSGTSNSMWGNFAHGAEICTTILPAEDYEQTGTFRAVMRPECSFWNKAIGPAGTAMRLGALLSPVPIVVPVPVKQPDWYILQHEQLHFAIMEAAARQLSEKTAEIPPDQRTAELTQRLLTITLSHTRERHAAFDAETSGTFEPQMLEKWVRVMERQLCGDEDQADACPVRTSGP